MEKIIKPLRLKIGDTIGLISNSSPMAGLVPHRLRKSVEMLEELGFKVKIGKNALKITDYTAGTALERAEDIHSFFIDPEVKAIISFIGGNHSNQVLKYLDFDLIKNNPKIFVGYSDTTVLHFAINTQTNLVTFYGPAALTQFGENPKIMDYTEKYFKKALMDGEPIGPITPSTEWIEEICDWFEKKDTERPRTKKENKVWQWIREGKAEGKILGGCISSMIHLRGTKYWPDFKNTIFFWEIPESVCDFNCGEKISEIDAYLADLELSGVFREISGMVIGRPFGYDEKQKEALIDLVKKYTDNYNFPILSGVDIGHTDPIITVPLGVKASMDSEKKLFAITEIGTE